MVHVHHFSAFNPQPDRGELTVLFSGHAQTKPSHKVGPQVLDYHLVHLVMSGKGVFRCLGRDYRLEKGHSFFISPGELVSYASDETEPWSYRWIGFKGSRADEFVQQFGVTPQQPVTVSRHQRRMAALFHRIERTLQTGVAGADMQAGGYLRLLFAEYAQDQAEEDVPNEEASAIGQQVEQAIRWLTLQYYQPISIEQMAQSLGYHRTHLSKMFKQHTGLSPMQYLLKIRMERAKLLLQEPLTVEQVASSVGFVDALYFSKQFKKWFGKSPTDYRHDQGYNPYDCM
ncbi:AraC family transcriptional regulator [Paenibacillus allorhizosphaerae]|uniref:HTH-type transcriptional activator RhaS n=1 Tax=Paenibacillus allorhizosphaerae TaxID=2849866 RepID=A0ABN7TUU7_9BACL|nr:AraC family transcriptional regulator [Paenibacillus allorhizosphaerae]CAG7650484.1 HTH-type transcriptional activator RhaS [Paenibacillus allorhizosphaerae]